MYTLLWLAAALVAIWLIFAIFVEVAGFAIHLLLFAAAVLVIAWFVRKGMERTRHA